MPVADCRKRVYWTFAQFGFDLLHGVKLVRVRRNSSGLVPDYVWTAPYATRTPERAQLLELTATGTRRDQFCETDKHKFQKRGRSPTFDICSSTPRSQAYSVLAQLICSPVPYLYLVGSLAYLCAKKVVNSSQKTAVLKQFSTRVPYALLLWFQFLFVFSRSQQPTVGFRTLNLFHGSFVSKARGLALVGGAQSFPPAAH